MQIVPNFRPIDPAAVDWSGSVMAQKTARVQAEFVPEGTALDTVMADGHVETKNVAPEGGSMKVTNPAGEQYLISPAKFQARYTLTENGDYAPKSDPVPVLRLNEGVSFTAPWGEEMRIKAGGVLVNGSGSDIYGIQPEEFEATYTILPEMQVPDLGKKDDIPSPM